MKRIEEVYFIDKNNAPQPHTIIENTIYKQNGYRVTHFSMGAGTSCSPERFHHLAIYTCNVGEVHIQVYEKDKTYTEIVLHPGDFWIRPCQTLCGLYVNVDTVFTIVRLRYTTNLIDTLQIGDTGTFLKHSETKETQVREKRIINDQFFTMDILTFGKNSRFEIEEDRNMIFSVLEGKCAILHCDKTIHMEVNQSFHTFRHGKTVVVCATEAKVVLLSFLN